MTLKMSRKSPRILIMMKTIFLCFFIRLNPKKNRRLVSATDKNAKTQAIVKRVKS